MTTKSKPKVRIVNPRYARAKPEDVGRALLRRAGEEQRKVATPKRKRK